MSDWSRAEIEGLLQRAFRGSGLSGGIAVEAARAVARYGSDGDLRAVALDLVNAPQTISAALHACDRAEAKSAPPSGGLVGLLWEDRMGAARAKDRLSPDEATLRALTERAALTYVPESASSRDSGAGAGGADRD
ncbi:MAG: DUF3726 domain-containing protein [Shimia sp.]